MVDGRADTWNNVSAGLTVTELAELYDRHAASVYGLAMHMLGDQRAAEEVVEEVFVAALGRSDLPARGARAGDFQVAAWLLRLAHRRCLERLGRRAGVYADAPPGASVAPLDPDYETRAERVRAALADLPDTERQVIELMYFQGMTRDEVAMQIACAYSDVHHFARLGLEKLREVLLADG
jgi:RNA polymerase sigma-70 factor (ECF subfamily)